MITSYQFTIRYIFLTSEIAFALYYYLLLLPRIKKESKKLPKNNPHTYRGYEKDRYKLYRRILSRIEDTCSFLNKPFYDGVERFLHAWMVNVDCKDKETEKKGKYNYDDLSNSDIISKKSNYDYEFTDIYKENIEELMTWAFFSKHLEDLEPWEKEDMQKMHDYAKDKNILIHEGKKEGLKANAYSFQDMRPIYRPLFVYLLMHLVYRVGACFLFIIGFRRHTSSTGLTYWFHQGYPCDNNLYPGKDQNQFLPMLFFHGIAPGGVSLYSPMLYFGFMKMFRMHHDGHQPPVFLFENPNISYQLHFHALTEQQTVQGVVEALKHNLPPRYEKVSLIGHSFGSAQLTWLLHGMPEYIAQLVLIDPVSILLSEPDVLSNFFHNSQNVNNSYTEQDRPQFQQSTKFQQKKIQLLASTEISIEYYLRNKFAWFNSELWLEDIPPHINVLILLSGQDCIVPTAKVKREVIVKNLDHVEMHVWEECEHGDCIIKSKYWKDIFSRMVRQQSSST